MPAIDRLDAAIRRGPVVLDAAIGTRLIASGLDLARDDPSLWAVDRPDIVADLHRRDVGAGADAILTNTFGANRDWLARFGRDAEAAPINARAASLARAAAGPDRLVLGAIGPTAVAFGLGEQAEALAGAGVDAFVLETHRLDQALAALRTLSLETGLPVVASLFAWPDGLTEAARRLEDAGAAAVGINCVVGMGEAARVAERLREATPLPLWIKPSAGLPGEIPESPEAFAASVASLVALGPVLVGGCCGTTEAHVATLRAGIDALAGRGRGV